MNSAPTLSWPEHRWKSLQAQRLASHLRHSAKSALYRSHALEEAAQQLESAQEVDSLLRQLPFTTKDQLAAAGREAVVVPQSAIAEWVCTSGTLGRPLDVPLTSADLERLAENEAAALALAGVGEGDLFIVAVGMERLFVAGLAYWLGARKLGAACVRAGPHLAVTPSMVKDLISRFGQQQRSHKTYLIAVPSFLAGADAPGMPIDAIITIGEPTRDGMRSAWPQNALAARLQTQFSCPVVSTYATTETCTTFAESPVCIGGHLNPWLGILEIVDDAGVPAPPGTVGEVVVTPLGVEGLPLVRFRTGDMAPADTRPCPCGRTTPRLGPIVGRKQQLLKFRGTSIYPNAILDALRGIPELIDCLIVAEQEPPPTLGDRLTVHLLLGSGADHARVSGILRSVLRVLPEIRQVTPEELQMMRASAGPGARKAVRFIDRRPAQIL